MYFLAVAREGGEEGRGRLFLCCLVQKLKNLRFFQPREGQWLLVNFPVCSDEGEWWWSWRWWRRWEYKVERRYVGERVVIGKPL